MRSTKEILLELLESGRGESLSGQQLAERLGVSRAAVWKAMDALKKEGHRIEAANNRGYRLLPESDVLTFASMAPWLPKGYDPALLRVFPEVDSTNTAVRRLAAEGVPEGTCVVAARQTGGKGRRGRSFCSPEGGVYLSMALRPQLTAEESAQVTTAAAVQVCRTIEALCGLRPAIKWVNDLMLGGKKICGILTEASVNLETGMPDYLVLGVGVNLKAPEGGFPAELAQIAGALYPGELPPGLTRGRFAAALLENLLPVSQLCGRPEIIEEYRARCPLPGHWATVITAGQPSWQAKVVGISDVCGLIVEKPDGTRTELRSGEVSVRPDEMIWR